MSSHTLHDDGPTFATIGTPCEYPLHGAAHVLDIDRYDGIPLLSLHRVGADLYLDAWGGIGDKSEWRILVRITRARLEAMLRGDVSFFRVFAESEDGRAFVVHRKGDDILRCAALTTRDDFWIVGESIGDVTTNAWGAIPTAEQLEGAR